MILISIHNTANPNSDKISFTTKAIKVCWQESRKNYKNRKTICL